MRTERESAIRLLRILMVASLVVPAALFAYVSYNDYHDVYAVADERIDRSLDVLQEQALKVFGTVDRIFPEVDEVVRDMSDQQISAAQPTLASRLQRIVAVMPEVQSIDLIGPDGKVIASNSSQPNPDAENFAEHDFFKAQAEKDVGTYISGLHGSSADIASEFFEVSRRLPSADGSFRGVVAVVVRPRYFDDFYAMIEQSPGNSYALVRSDGLLLARYPAVGLYARQLSPKSMLRTAIDHGVTHGLFSVDSAEIDHVDRRIGFRKLPDYPVYAIASIEKSALRAQWLSHLASHLIFGLPATLLLFVTLWVALRRTRGLHEEAERRELAEDALRQAQRLEAIGQLTGGVPTISITF
jgi:two-component system, NtrC family, sensor kinase